MAGTEGEGEGIGRVKYRVKGEEIKVVCRVGGQGYLVVVLCKVDSFPLIFRT